MIKAFWDLLTNNTGISNYLNKIVVGKLHRENREIRRLKYTENVTFCNILWWLPKLRTPGAKQSSSNFLANKDEITFYQVNYGIYRTIITGNANNCEPIGFFYEDKCDAKEKKSKHHCFVHIAKLQEAEWVSLSPSECTSPFFNVRSDNTCCLTFLTFVFRMGTQFSKRSP